MEQQISTSASRKSREEKPTRVSCPLCPDSQSTSFTSFKKLEEHITSIHVSIEYYACPLCTEALSNEDALFDHLMTHENPPLFEKKVRYLGMLCADCGLYARISSDGTTRDCHSFTHIMTNHSSDSLVPVVVHAMRPLEKEPQLRQWISRVSRTDMDEVQGGLRCPHCHVRKSFRIDMKKHLLEGRCVPRLPSTRLALAARQECARDIPVDDLFVTGGARGQKSKENHHEETILRNEDKKVGGSTQRSRIVPRQRDKSGISQRFGDKAEVDDWDAEEKRNHFDTLVTIPIFRRVEETIIEYTPNGLADCLNSCPVCKVLIAGFKRGYEHKCTDGVCGRALKLLFSPKKDCPNKRIRCPECETHVACSVLGLQVHLSLAHNQDYKVDEWIEEVSNARSPMKGRLPSLGRPSEPQPGPSKENRQPLRVKISVDPVTKKHSVSSSTSPLSRRSQASTGDSVDSDNEGGLVIDESEPMETDVVAEEAVGNRATTNVNAEVTGEQAVKDDNMESDDQEMTEEQTSEQGKKEEPKVDQDDEPNTTTMQYAGGPSAEKNEAGPSNLQIGTDENKELVDKKLELEEYYFQPPRSSYLPKESFFHLCRICMTIMPEDREAYERHMQRHTTEERALVSCPKCSLLVRQEDMMKHLKQKRKLRMICTVCVKAFPDDIRYYCHLARDHSVDLIHFCARCNIATKSVAKMKDHVASAECMNRRSYDTFHEPFPGVIGECRISFEGGLAPGGDLVIDGPSSIVALRDTSRLFCKIDCVKRSLILPSIANDDPVIKFYRASCPFDLFLMLYHQYSDIGHDRTPFRKLSRQSDQDIQTYEAQQRAVKNGAVGVRGIANIASYFFDSTRGARESSAVSTTSSTRSVPSAAPVATPTASASAAAPTRPHVRTSPMVAAVPPTGRSATPSATIHAASKVAAEDPIAASTTHIQATTSSAATGANIIVPAVAAVYRKLQQLSGATRTPAAPALRPVPVAAATASLSAVKTTPVAAAATTVPSLKRPASPAAAAAAPPAKQARVLTDEESKMIKMSEEVDVNVMPFYTRNFCRSGTELVYTAEQKRATMLEIEVDKDLAPMRMTRCLFCHSTRGVYNRPESRLEWIQSFIDSSRCMNFGAHYNTKKKRALCVCARHFAPSEIYDNGCLVAGALPKFMIRTCLVCEDDIAHVGLEVPIFFEEQLEVLSRVPRCRPDLETMRKKCAEGIQYSCPSHVIVATILFPEMAEARAQIEIEIGRERARLAAEAAQRAKEKAADDARRSANEDTKPRVAFRAPSVASSSAASTDESITNDFLLADAPSTSAAAAAAAAAMPPPTAPALRPQQPRQQRKQQQQISPAGGPGMPQHHQTPQGQQRLQSPPQLQHQVQHQQPIMQQQQYQQARQAGPMQHPTPQQMQQPQLPPLQPLTMQQVQQIIQQNNARMQQPMPQPGQPPHPPTQQQLMEMQRQHQLFLQQQQQRPPAQQQLQQAGSSNGRPMLAAPAQQVQPVQQQLNQPQLRTSPQQPQPQQQGTSRVIQQQPMQQPVRFTEIPGASADEMRAFMKRNPLLPNVDPAWYSDLVDSWDNLHLKQQFGQAYQMEQWRLHQVQLRQLQQQKQLQHQMQQQHILQHQQQPQTQRQQQVQQPQHPQQQQIAQQQLQQQRQQQQMMQQQHQMRQAQPVNLPANAQPGAANPAAQDARAAAAAYYPTRAAGSPVLAAVLASPPQVPPPAGPIAALAGLAAAPAAAAPKTAAPAATPAAAAAAGPSTSLKWKHTPSKTEFICRLCVPCTKPAGTPRVAFPNADVALDELRITKNTFRRHMLATYWTEDPDDPTVVVCKAHVEPGANNMETGVPCAESNCGQKCLDDDNEQRLHTNHRNGEMRFCCRDCFAPLPGNELAVIRHMKNHHGFVLPSSLRLACPLKGNGEAPCDHESPSIPDYIKHLGNVHGNYLQHAYYDQSFAKHICGIRFKNSDAKDLHTAQIAEQQRLKGNINANSHCCPLCGSCDFWVGEINGQKVNHLSLHALEWTTMCRFDFKEVRRGNDSFNHYLTNHYCDPTEGHQAGCKACQMRPSNDEDAMNHKTHSDRHLIIGFNVVKEKAGVVHTSDTCRALLGL